MGVDLALIFKENCDFSTSLLLKTVFVERLLAKFTFRTIAFCSTLRIGPYLFYIEKFTTQFKTTEKNDCSP